MSDIKLPKKYLKDCGEKCYFSLEEWLLGNISENSVYIKDTLDINTAGNNGEIQFNNNGSFGADSNLVWDNTNKRLGVGTATPVQLLDLNGDLGVSKISAGAQSNSRNIVLKYEDSTGADHSTTIFARPTGSGSNFTIDDSRNNRLLNVSNAAIAWNDGNAIISKSGLGVPYNFSGNSPINLYTGSTSQVVIYSNVKPLYLGTEGTNNSRQLGIFTTGNVLIQNGGTFTDAGFRLDVNGTARVNGQLTTKGSGITSGSFSLISQNSSNENILRVRNDGALLIGNISASAAQLISPIDASFQPSISGGSLGLFLQGGFGSTGRIVLRQNTNLTSTSGNQGVLFVNATFNPTSGTGVFESATFNPIINQTGGANGITRGLFINPTLTSAANWRSIEWSNNTGWGLYGNGIANNYLGGNLLINTTTDAGFKLDVNGTARISNTLQTDANAIVNGVNIGRGGGNIVSNTINGTNALQFNTSGGTNTALGGFTLRFNTTGGQNTAVGYFALYSNNGNLNTAVGRNAMASNTTGGNNVGIGSSALTDNTTGSNNVGVGNSAGRYIDGGANELTIANNSVFLGAGTRALADNQTNQIVIGHSAIGAGSNTATIGNTSITLTVLRGTINAANLPTSSAGLNAGDIWNNGGVLNIV